MNEQLIVSALRQHELTEQAEGLNEQLRREIAGHKKTEDALRESKARLEFTLESARIGDWDLDLATDQGRRSLRHDQAFGYHQPVEQWGYTKFLTHVHPEDRAEVDRSFGAAVAGRTEWHFECRVIWPDASVHWIEAHGNIYRTDRGLPRNMLGIVSDITARKTAEEKARLALEELARVSRAKDDFLARLSHELRTPLTPVLLAAAALREDEQLPPGAREQLSMMERNIALEARLIDDLLDVTAISHGKMKFHVQWCDAHFLIGLAMEIVGEEARAKGVSIECTLAAKPCGVVADPARFQQVIWNLLRNAVKFTPRGGTISVRTSVRKTPAGAAWLRIEVADSGVGIDPARIEQIFLPFNQGGLTGEHHFGGLGLGLTIARAVVDGHGGRITAESAGRNRGTSFIIELPGAGGPGPMAREIVSPPRAGALVRVLVVEDHASTLQALCGLLERDGHHVVPAATITEALAAAGLEKFDLLISDLGLPDGTGIELRTKLRGAHGFKSIALSGYGMEEDLARSRAAGFDSHLVKPVSIVALRHAIALLMPGAGREPTKG